MKLVNARFAVITPLLFACNHPIEIVGKGDVTSASGTRNCYLEQFQAGAESCTKNSVVGGYHETYYAQPRPGYAFDHWENCAQQFPTCTIDITAAMVQPFWGQTTPPLRAVFVPTLTIYRDNLLFNGRLETCEVKGIPPLHCAQVIDPATDVQVRFELQLDNNYISVSSTSRDHAGNPKASNQFVTYGTVIHKRVWETGFDVVGVDAVFDSGGITFFHVHLDKGQWSVTHGAKAIPGSELFDLWTEGGYTEWYREATGGIWEEQL